MVLLFGPVLLTAMVNPSSSLKKFLAAMQSLVKMDAN
jgi:hypothetical protein